LPDLPDLRELARLRAREDELLRAVAESQNVLRRRRQEMDANVRHAEEAVVRDLLPVLDDLERALAAMSETADPSIRTGVSLVKDRLVGVLEQRGLRAIRPQGEPFDPELHDALAQRPAADARPGTVVEVVQPGYRFRDRVLRHAKVIVASAPEPEASGTESAARRSE
jgi:molecular chaperone GrpE